MHGYGGFGMFSLMNTLFPIFFTIIFVIVIFNMIKGVGQWSSNNKQPVITVVAELVGKRGHISRNNHHHDNHIHSSSSTTYYATFQVESGDRIEFNISSREFGMLAEGDIGKLTFQGTRYHGFERTIN